MKAHPEPVVLAVLTPDSAAGTTTHATAIQLPSVPIRGGGRHEHGDL